MVKYRYKLISEKDEPSSWAEDMSGVESELNKLGLEGWRFMGFQTIKSLAVDGFSETVGVAVLEKITYLSVTDIAVERNMQETRPAG